MQSGGTNFSLDWMNSIRNSWNSVIANPLSTDTATYLNNLKFRSDLTAKGNNHASEYIYNDPKSPYYNPNFQQDNIHINNANQYDAWQKAKLDPNYDPREWEHMNNAEGYDPNLLPIDQANYDKQYPGFDRNQVIMENMAGAFSLLKGQEAYDAKPKDNFIQESGFKGFKRYDSGGTTGNSPKTPYDNYLTKYWGNNYNDAIAILTGNGISSGENRQFNPKAVNKNKNGSMDLGLFQVNSNTFKDFKNRRGKELAQYGIYTYEQMKDPEKNTILAKMIFDEQGHNAFYGSPYNKNNINKLKQHSPLKYYNLENIEQDNTQIDTTLFEEQPVVQPMSVNEGFNLNSKFAKFQNGSLVNYSGYTPGTESFNNPINIIPDNNITMKNTPFDILAIPDNDNPKIMKANSTGHKFKKSSKVLEVPLYQSAGTVTNPTPVSTTFTIPNKSTTLAKPSNIAPVLQQITPRTIPLVLQNLNEEGVLPFENSNSENNNTIQSFKLKGDNTYEYAKQGDKYLTRKIGSSNWIDMSTALTSDKYKQAVNTIEGKTSSNNRSFSNNRIKKTVENIDYPFAPTYGVEPTQTDSNIQFPVVGGISPKPYITDDFTKPKDKPKKTNNTSNYSVTGSPFTALGITPAAMVGRSANTNQPKAYSTIATTAKTDIFGREIKPRTDAPFLYSLDKQYTDKEGQLALDGVITAASTLPVARAGKGAINIGGAILKGSEKKIKTITDAINSLIKSSKTTTTTSSGKAIKFKKTNPRTVFNTK